MKTIRLGMSKLTVAEKIQKARSIISLMDGNPNFSNPNPTLAQVATAVSALEKAYEDALDGGKSNRVILQLCHSELCDLMQSLAAYVQNISNGKETIINSSGFDVKRVSNRANHATNPSHVRGQSTTHEGEVLIRWKGAKGARAYIAEMSRDGLAWTICGTSTKTKLVVSGLVEGTKQMFRVAALSAAGQSGWSDPGSVWVIG